MCRKEYLYLLNSKQIVFLFKRDTHSFVHLYHRLASMNLRWQTPYTDLITKEALVWKQDIFLWKLKQQLHDIYTKIYQDANSGSIRTLPSPVPTLRLLNAAGDNLQTLQSGATQLQTPLWPSAIP